MKRRLASREVAGERREGETWRTEKGAMVFEER